MVPQSLIDYIRQMRNAGYSDEQVINTLLSHGYSQEIVEEAFQYFRPDEIKHTIHLSKTTVITVLAIVIILVGTGIFLFGAFDIDFGAESLLDVGIESLKTNVIPGENIIFVVDISNLGSKKRFDINLKHELIDSDGNTVVYKEETKAVETSRSYQTSLKMPEDVKPGKYNLKTTANYDGKTADAVIIITVEAIVKTSCSDGIKNQGEEGIDCGGSCKACSSCSDNIKDGDEEGVDCGGSCKQCPVCPSNCDDDKDCTKDLCSADTGFECKHETIKNCCGNIDCEDNENYNNCPADCKKNEEDIFEGLTIWETIDKINEIAKTNPTLAKKYCNDIEQKTFRDQCLLDIGETAKDTNICKEISEERYKDDCFSNVAKTKKDANICQLIVKSSRRDSCLMNFVIDLKDYSVCEEIANQYLKQSCESLRDLSSNQ